MKIIGFVMLLMLPGFSRAGDPATTPTTSLNYYLNLFSSSDGGSSVSDKAFLDFVDKLESKQGSSRDDQSFLHHVFVKTHQKFLKDFAQYASFRELFSDGKYNCLTGTALYALILDHFNIDYKIIETNYHIFIIANTAKGDVLLEATDPVQGFVNNSDEINRRIEGYKQNKIQEINPDKNYYQFSFELYNEVHLDQLLGLMHYNLAIVDYNGSELQSAITHLDKAFELYDSPRIEEFSRVLTLSVVESSLTPSLKEFYVKKLQSIRKKHNLSSASAKAN